MKLLRECKLALIVSAFMLLTPLFASYVWFNFLSIVIIVSVWLWQINKFIIESNNHNVINDRVNQLKKLGLELQGVVNQELILVQEDVVRIKDIVSDSIGVLQKNIESMNDKCAEFIVNEVESTNVNQKDDLNSYKNVKEKFSVACGEINNIARNIKEFEDISKKMSLIANAYVVETAKVGHCNESFQYTENTMQDVTVQTPKLINHIQESVCKLEVAVEEIEQLESVDESHSIKRCSASINASYISNPIQNEFQEVTRALQFEDIVSQISERVAQHVGDIRLTVDLLSHLHDSEFSSTFDQDLDSIKEKLSEVKCKLSSSSAKEIANQKNMDEGDVELF